MNLAIDARWIFAQRSGIGIHTAHLIQGLAEQGESAVLLAQDEARVRERTGTTWPLQNVPYGIFSPRSQVQLPRLLRRLKVDLYHSTNYMMPLFCPPGIKRVVTIHDLIPMRFRDHAPRSKKARLYPVYARLMQEIARRADAIITVSEASRRDVLELLHPCNPAKVHVVYNGIAPHFHPAPGGTRGNDVLYVGRGDPYKKVSTLLEAFARVQSTGKLLLVGADDARYPEARQVCQRLGLGDRVVWCGGLSDEELVRAYQNAAVLVLASTYEGFGLPVVEAMACGTPVICSNTSSLPEVAGDAALRVTPGSVDELAQALRRVFEEPGLAETLSARGPAQAAKFDIATMARSTLSVYRSLLA